MEPPRRGRHARYRLALATAIVLLILVSGVVTVFAAPLAVHGIAAA
jgi:hypothetical protein